MSLFRESLLRSWHLTEKVDFDDISLMKKVGSSVCCHYLNGHCSALSVQRQPHSFDCSALKKGFVPSSFLGAQFVFASNIVELPWLSKRHKLCNLRLFGSGRLQMAEGD